MSQFSSSPTIVVRASDNIDPTVVGYEEVELAFKVPHVERPSVGEGEEDIGYNKRGPRLERYGFTFSLLELYINVASGTQFNTIADIHKLQRICRTYDYVWLYRVYSLGGNHGAGYFPYADESGNDALFNLTTDTPAGICPYLVELVGDPSISPPAQSVVRSDITLEGRSII